MSSHEIFSVPYLYKANGQMATDLEYYPAFQQCPHYTTIGSDIFYPPDF
jgi:hypothetical protein